MSDEIPGSKSQNHGALSLNRLRNAFAAMLGEQAPAAAQQGEQHDAPSQLPALCEINPRTVVEAILFVGRPDNRAVSARELAAAMRGVSPGEIDAAVRDLNSCYDADEAPYSIESTSSGYRLVLREQFQRLRDKFYGRVREARLSPVAVELLSVVAYNQPITADAIQSLRGAPNGAVLSTLVRRRLIRIDRGDDGTPRYATTERFLKLFGLESLEALPQSEELEKV